MERLVKLLKEQEDLQYDNTISDEMYYILDERLTNEISNYSVKEIEEAQKIINESEDL